MTRLLVGIGTALSFGIMLMSGNGSAELHVSATGTDTPMLFVSDRCGASCDSMRDGLAARFDFEELDAFDNGVGTTLYDRHGGFGRFPYVVIGEQRIVGNDPGAIISAIAIEYGDWQLPVEEREALGRHFDADGNPQFVMYQTETCGYCDKARDYLAGRGITPVEYNIEHDLEARRDYDALQGMGTPLIYRGFERVQGFNIAGLEPLIDAE